MRIGITGATGLIGRAVTAQLAARDHEITAFSRQPRSAGGLVPEGAGTSLWPPGSPDAFSGLDAVVHLAGQTISKRWTRRQKRAIRDSRVEGTGTLIATLGKLPAGERPGRLITASAVGYYGPRDDEALDEDAAPGEGFLAEVCQEWEAAAQRARALGVRTACLRFGVVLSPVGGALASMLTPFRLGLGGRLGSGRQWMPWIHRLDAAGAVVHLLEAGAASLRETYNVTAPEPARNADFTRTLGRALGRPTVFPAPAFALRLLLGEMAEGLLLTGQRVVPRNLLEDGFRFLYPDLPGALAELLEAHG